MPFNPLDQVAFIKVELLADGGLSITGNIGDAKLALSMIAHAHDEMKKQLVKKLEKRIIIPNRDVDVRQDPAYPTRPLGDMKPEERGDQ